MVFLLSMKRMKLGNKVAFVIAIFFMISCTSKSDYHKIVEKELASGIRYDSLFLGMSFGMSSEDFYKRCWELNKEGLIREGGNNATVYHEINDLDDKAAMEFYPIFKDEKIQSMTGHFHYLKWAPWNKETFADVLIVKVKDMLEDWYGEGFIKVPSPGVGEAYTKIDGNRRIVLYYTKDEKVEMLISDLTNDDGILTLNKNAED